MSSFLFKQISIPFGRNPFSDVSSKFHRVFKTGLPPKLFVNLGKPFHNTSFAFSPFKPFTEVTAEICYLREGKR